jgi:hypothetical protein
MKRLNPENLGTQSLTDARLDAIFAAVRHCSKSALSTRIHLIVRLLSTHEDCSIITAVNHMEWLIEKLRLFSRKPHGEVYERARTHILMAWRQVMRGEYDEACKHLRLAVGCCHDMA